MNKRLTFLLLVFIFALMLRLIDLNATPDGFTWDEAALGYNAFSLTQTGRDEWGLVAPIIFKSFDDYKPGLYVYLTTPAIFFLGLNEFSTRLPSAFLGSLSTILVYVLVKSLNFSKYKINSVAAAAACLWAINPWMILFSRGAWEANIWIFLTLLSINLWIRSKYYLSSLFMGLTLLNYQGAKMLTPLILVILFLFFRKGLNSKKLFVSLCLILLISAPIVLSFSDSSGRLQVFSMFSYTRSADTIDTIKIADSNIFNPNIQYQLFHSETLNHIRGFAERYLNHLSPRFIFTEGDWSNLRHSVPFHGNFYLFEIVTIAIGVWVVAVSIKPKTAFFLIMLVFASILPSALSRDIVSGLRSLPLAIPLVIFSAVGLAKVLEKKLFSIPTILIVFFSAIYFLDVFFVHSKYYNSTPWLSVMQPVFEKISEIEDNYSRVVISDKLGQPYIFALFYGSIHPRDFISSKVFTPSPVGDVGHVSSFGKYLFRPVYWPVDRGEPSTLFVAPSEQLPENDVLTTNNTVWYQDVVSPDKQTLFRIVGREYE